VPSATCKRTHDNPFINPSRIRWSYFDPRKDVRTVIKIHTLDCCEFCDGEASVFVCEDDDARGELFDRDHPYEMCDGSDNQTK